MEHLLVFVGDNEKEMVQAATYAAKHGFARTATLAGGLQALECIETQKVSSSCAPDMQLRTTVPECVRRGCVQESNANQV